ncbi:MAG: alpha/beta fold hydrolase, partial [Acidimicrobiia bacterium]|nr:alpha/beta fold hydrolase [Acidimicrobiia bacterium]
MTTTTVTTPDQTTLFVRDLGSGTAAVLLHGWTVGHELWDRQFETLPAAGVRCVAYDRRGCGRSSAPDQGYDYDTLADDLHAVLAQLGLGDVTLVAHSMAVGEALRYLARHSADRISSLVLVAPTTPDLLPPPLLDAMVSAMQSDLPGYLAAGAPGFFGRDASPELLDWGVGLAARAPLPVAVELTRTFATTDLRSELAVVTVPTVV